MKFSIYITLFLINFGFATSSFATIHRVNNSGVPADFTTLTAAMSAASTGDTIHLEPSGISYGHFSVNKNVVVIGNGFFLDQNTGLQHNTGESIVNDLYMFSTGNGSKIIGLTIQGTSLYPWNSGAANFTFMRCHITASLNTQYNAVTDNILFDGCYLDGGINLTTSLTTEYLFNNCYFEALKLSFSSATHGIFNNCIFNLSEGLTQGLIVGNYQFTNNILLKGNFIDNGANSFDHNLCNLAQFPVATNNLRNVNMNTVFVGYPTQGAETDDSRWELAGGSPAIGAGVSGVDCGIFGGAGPYKLSGIPPVPTIYDLIAPGSAGNSMQVIISTRVNN